MKKTILFSTIVLILTIFSQNILAIGQMTKPIVVENILRGTEITETLILINSEDKEVSYELKADGDIKDWATFYNVEDQNLENPITEIQIPAKSNINAIVKFTLPEDLPNGQYSGEVAVTFTPEVDPETGETTATVSQRIGREVLITVTDKEIINFTTTVIPLKYDVKKGEPLEIKFIYDNQGNIFIRPDVQIKIIKSGEIIFNAIFPYPENEEPVKPKARKELVPFEWQTAGQENGFYTAELKIMLNGEIIQEEDFRFSIGYKPDSKFLAAIGFIGFGSVVRGWFIIGGILLLLALLLNLIYKKKYAKAI